MSLLAPALLAGLIGLAIPVIAHLLGREPPRTVRFAALRFLPQAEQSVTHRRSVRDVPLLLVRLAILALLVVVLARPATHERAGVSVIAEVHDAVVLVDGSRSMGLTVEGETALLRAEQRVEALLDSLPAGSRVALTSSDPGGPQVDMGQDRDRVRAAIEDWIKRGAPRPGAWTMRDALPSAASLFLEDEPDRKRVIYAVGDATGRGLASLPETAEGGVPILPVPVFDEGTALPEHVGIVAVDWEPAPDLDPRAVRVQATVRRYTAEPPADATPTQTVGLALYIDELEVARATVELEVGKDTPVEFTHTLLEESTDAAAATVSLIDVEGDALPSDDRRHLWLAADEGLEVVVVNGDPSELRAHDEVFFLTTAVAAAGDSRRLHLRSLAPDQLETQLRKRGAAALAGIDVLVLSNVRAPSQDVAPLVVQSVEDGMGLWITVGDRVDADAYNARLAKVLPLRMREAVQVGTLPGRAEARIEGIAPADLSHPAFRGLGGELGLSGTRARKIVLLEPDADRPARIALSFTSGAPALLSLDVGRGRTALLTTSVDRDWADLPLRPGFVPLVTATLSYLGRAHGGVAGTAVLVGAPRALRSSAPAIVTTPAGRDVSVAPNRDGIATFTDTFVPGHYRARTPEAQTVFAVEVDAAESDTQPAQVTEAQLDADRRQVNISVPRWRQLVLLVALLLALEAILRLRRRRRKA